MPGGFYFAIGVILTSATGYPASGFYPTTLSAIPFLAASLDFIPCGSSPLTAKGTDGPDLGADVDAINTAIAGVVVA